MEDFEPALGEPTAQSAKAPSSSRSTVDGSGMAVAEVDDSGDGVEEDDQTPGLRLRAKPTFLPTVMPFCMPQNSQQRKRREFQHHQGN